MRKTTLLLVLIVIAIPLIAFADGPRTGTGLRLGVPEVVALGPPLRATAVPLFTVVYVVGDIDNGGPGTAQYVSLAEANVAKMRDLGLHVVEFYPPDNRWEDIKAAARDARILVYAGHGIFNWDGDPQKVGGFALRSDEFVHPDRIRDELRMQSNAIVIFNHACFTAGSSALDTGVVSMEEAQRRVAMYSQPFLEAGLVGYFANNYFNSPSTLVEWLVGGSTLEEAYKRHYAFSPDSARLSPHPQLPQFSMWVDVDGSGEDVTLAACEEPTTFPVPTGMTVTLLLPMVRVS